MNLTFETEIVQEFCELGVISVGADGVISATAPPAEIAHYDDGMTARCRPSSTHKYPSKTYSDVTNPNEAPLYLTPTPR
eukprot:SAG31_NODE_97_length_25714_cov_19.477142_3_plen_79_part_00